MTFSELVALLVIIALAFLTGMFYERLRSQWLGYDFPEDHSMDDDPNLR